MTESCTSYLIKWKIWKLSARKSIPEWYRNKKEHNDEEDSTADNTLSFWSARISKQGPQIQYYKSFRDLNNDNIGI